MSPVWLTAFLDVVPGHDAAAAAFWAAATRSQVSSWREDTFATLVPPDGDAFLRVQRLGSGEDRVHLDLHVVDPRVAADAAVALGAVEVADLGHVLVTSPGGMPLCFVPESGEMARPEPVRWPSGHTSLLDQVCVDIPSAIYDDEVAFWAAVTGWEPARSDLPEFGYLVRPPDQPLRLLLQRLGPEDPGPVRAHLDLATTDRAAEVERLAALGARVAGEGKGWTVLQDLTGRTFCVTDRRP